MREWLVIEDSMANAVFATEAMRLAKGYIPRDVAEDLLNRDLSGGQWFTKDESALMRSQSEWRDTAPESAQQAPHEEEA